MTMVSHLHERSAASVLSFKLCHAPACLTLPAYPEAALMLLHRGAATCTLQPQSWQQPLGGRQTVERYHVQKHPN